MKSKTPPFSKETIRQPGTVTEVAASVGGPQDCSDVIQALQLASHSLSV